MHFRRSCRGTERLQWPKSSRPCSAAVGDISPVLVISPPSRCRLPEGFKPQQVAEGVTERLKVADLESVSRSRLAGSPIADSRWSSAAVDSNRECLTVIFPRSQDYLPEGVQARKHRKGGF